MGPIVRRLFVGLAVWIAVAGCGKSARTEAETPPLPPKNSLVLTFTYGSEKEDWVNAATAAFNQSGVKTADGKAIQVNAIPLGSGECIDSLLNETIKADITSPASAAFIKIGNAQSRTKTGRDLVGSTENLVLSPVVIAMWKPMAEALGWPGKPVGWSDILALAKTRGAWSAKGFPQWGEFKFGHTHPEYSNSGLISLFAEVYAATGKVSGLTLDDLQMPQTAAYLSGIEQSVVHYGSSTGFFGKKMFAGGPGYLSAAVLYENMVIESYSGKYQTPFPVVAIYPKEGTFWSDHPAGIVDRDWVTPARRDAAKKYIDFLLAPAQQQQALQFGFHPALPEIPLAAPLDAAHGVDPNEPQTTLEVPGNEVIDATLRLWHENKKQARITLVFDVSGSMRKDNRIDNARLGGLELLKQIDDSDLFALDPFNNRLLANEAPAPLKDKRAAYERQISSLFADGGTALYDSIDAAYQMQMSTRGESGSSITAVVVLTDGADTDSELTLEQLIQRIQSDNETRNIRVFTIGYGAEAQQDVLERIANATQAKFYKGTPQNIREVFKEIATFF
ncbi:MAG TPA: VWA domain-containing protein [Chthoniobacterales bacterium]